MALILYLTKAPRYKNIMTDIYETIPLEDILLIEKYYNWKRERAIGSKYSCDTLEEWCGVSEDKLAHKYIVNYYNDFYKLRDVNDEVAGEHKAYGICEQLARLVKTNQILNWFMRNVTNGEIPKGYYEITKEQLKKLLDDCSQVKSGCTFVHTNEYGEDEYIVDESVSKEILPLMDEKGYFFGPDDYGSVYAMQVIEASKIVERVLATTDFEKEAVYFNANW